MWKEVPVQPLYLSASEALPTATRTRGARLARLPGSSAKPGEVAEPVLSSPKAAAGSPLGSRAGALVCSALGWCGAVHQLAHLAGRDARCRCWAGSAASPCFSGDKCSQGPHFTSFSPSNTSSVMLKNLTCFENEFAFPCVALSPVHFLCFPRKSRALRSRVALNYELLQYLVGCNSTLISAVKTHQAKDKCRL